MTSSCSINHAATFLGNVLYEYQKTGRIIGIHLYVDDISYHKVFFSFGGVWAWLMCPLTTCMFVTNMLLWWIIDSVPLVTEPKILKEALEWRS